MSGVSLSDWLAAAHLVPSASAKEVSRVKLRLQHILYHVLSRMCVVCVCCWGLVGLLPFGASPDPSLPFPSATPPISFDAGLMPFLARPVW